MHTKSLARVISVSINMSYPCFTSLTTSQIIYSYTEISKALHSLNNILISQKLFMLDNTSYIIFKKFKSSIEIMLSQKLNLIQRDNLQELVCTITSCEFKFLIQRIFSTFLEKSQIVSAVFKWQKIQSSGSGKKSNTVKRTTAENVNRVTGGRAGTSYRLVLRNVARCLGWWRARAANEPSAKFSQSTWHLFRRVS